MTYGAKSAKFISTIGRRTELFYGAVKTETAVVKRIPHASYFFELDMIFDFFRDSGTVLV